MLTFFSRALAAKATANVSSRRMISAIKGVKAREIIDSHGNPTIEVDVTTADGTVTASVPSGASMRIRITNVENSTIDDTRWHHRSNLEKIIRPNLKSYMFVMQAVASSLDNFDKYQDSQNEEYVNKIIFIDNLLLRLIEESKNDVFLQPDVHSFAMVMNAWVKYGRSSQKVEQLLHRMHKLHDEGWNNLQPNVVIYNILLNAWAKEGKINNIEKTLQRMIRLEIPGVSPDSISYSTLLAAYAKSNMPQEAESLLEQMLELYWLGMDAAKPTIISFTNVIQCYANVGNGFKADRLFRKLNDLYHNKDVDSNRYNHHCHDPDHWKPDLPLFNTVLLAFAKSGRPQNAEEFLRRVLTRDEKKTHGFDENIKPDSRSFNIVLSALAKIGEADRAESLLMEMHELHTEQQLDTRPTVVSYNIVLDAYAKKSTRMKNFNDKKNTHRLNNRKTTGKVNTRGLKEDEPWFRAEAIFHHMLELYGEGGVGIRTWNTVLNVCAKGGKIDKAEKILDRLIALSKSSLGIDLNIMPSVRTWNILLSAYAIQGDISRAKHCWRRMKKSEIRPDIVSYNTLLNCCVKSFRIRKKRSRNSGNIEEDVEFIFKELMHDQNVLANHITYLTMINFWINKKKTKRAEQFLLKVIQEHKKSNNGVMKISDSKILFPLRSLFHKVMTGWLITKKPENAEQLLLKMTELSDDGFDGLQPNTETYNILINCWAKSNKWESGECAEAILRGMEGLVSAGKEKVITNRDSYNFVLEAWSNSGGDISLIRIEKLIREMVSLENPGVLPDSDSYELWLKTIAASNGRVDKIQKGKEVIMMMKTHNFCPNGDIRRKILLLSDS